MMACIRLAGRLEARRSRSTRLACSSLRLHRLHLLTAVQPVSNKSRKHRQPCRWSAVSRLGPSSHAVCCSHQHGDLLPGPYPTGSSSRHGLPPGGACVTAASLRCCVCVACVLTRRDAFTAPGGRPGGRTMGCSCRASCSLAVTVRILNDRMSSACSHSLRQPSRSSPAMPVVPGLAMHRPAPRLLYLYSKSLQPL